MQNYNSKFKIFDPRDKNYSLINGVVTYPLKVNQDERGILVECLKTNWKEVFDQNSRPFTQCYYSITNAGVARDENRWHYHPTKQEDRFVVIKGKIIVVIYDWRQESQTYGTLNLFLMEEFQDKNGQYLLLIPKNVLHCFKVSQEKPAILLNFPTTLYDPQEEGRIPFEKVKLANNSCFSWEKIGDF